MAAPDRNCSFWHLFVGCILSPEGCLLCKTHKHTFSMCFLCEVLDAKKKCRLVLDVYPFYQHLLTLSYKIKSSGLHEQSDSHCRIIVSVHLRIQISTITHNVGKENGNITFFITVVVRNFSLQTCVSCQLPQSEIG